MILVPSRFERCGLTQLCGLRYGTLPIVARTGGLADTVMDATPAALAMGVATGWQIVPNTAAALRLALFRALRLFAERATWRKMQQAAMRRPTGWRLSAELCAALYQRLVVSGWRQPSAWLPTAAGGEPWSRSRCRCLAQNASSTIP